ncbi:MAG: hypothetical protein WAM58_09515 [Candidatus Acidiferrum sp.]
MNVFDLLFIVLFFVAAFSFFAAVWFALRHQVRRALGILTRILLGAAVYFTVVVAVSLIGPRRILKVGDRQCFDDMCVSVSGYQRVPEKTGLLYRVDMGLFNSGRGVSQRENNLVMYLTDDHGRRYDPVSDNSYDPFNVKLRPQESTVVSRTFLIPENAKGIGAVITHEGGFPIGWFIIDYDTWFRRPPLAPLS